MPTSTTNYGLIKPGTDDPILIGQINDNMDTIDTVLKDHSDKIDAAALGIKFKGEVNYYSNLPNGAEIGDAYTVKYAGSSGTTPDGTEYVWGAVSGVNQWINFSKDSYSKAEVDALLALKQDALTTAQLAAANSGINSAKVEQIATNASDISDIETALSDKVDKETGKGLSTNDFTTAEKTKLDDLAEIKSIGTGLNLDDNGELTATGGGSGGTTNYNDLSNKPQINGNTLSGNKTSAQLGLASASDIPTVPITAIQKNGTGITPVSGTVNITVPTTAADVSALPSSTKYAAALSLTINSSTFVMTGQLKDQNGDNLGTAQTIDLPLESVVVGGSYNSQTKKVVLTLQNGNTIEFSVADLVSGLQTELSASNKLNPAYINYDSTHRAVSDTEKSTWNGKQNALSAAQLAAANSGIDSAKVAQIETNKNNILLLTENGGGLNILDIQNPVTHVKTSYTPLSNGGVELSCSTPDSAWTNYNIADIPCITGKTYKVYIYIDEVSTNPVAFRVYLRQNDSSGANYIDQRITQTGCISYTITAATNKFWTGIYLNNSDTARTVTTKMRMMIVQSDTDVPYQPYAMSNAELTAAIQALQAQLANQ